MSQGFKAGLIHLTPIVVSLLFSVGCACLLMTSAMELYSVTPFPESPVGSLGNAIYFVALVGFGAFIIFLLLKKRNYRLIVLVTGFALTSATFLLSMVYIYAFSLVFVPLPLELIVAVSAATSFAVGYVILGTKSRLGDFIVVLLGGSLGTLLGACIQTLSAVLILCFLSIYDAFAVYRGPVGKIAHAGLEKLRGLSFSFKDLQMGLGDLTFYSMLVGHMLLYFGVSSCAASMVGVLLGCLLAFKTLERMGVFPGLPIPISLGLAFGFLAALI
ncbi:MAG: presenilin family intramembrane aspartyl protease [Candidatus Bathyarchaeia archaeon]